MTVTYREYEAEKTLFIQKHNKKSDCKVDTSPMVDNVYHKEYCWEHGAAWYERTERVTEIVEFEKYGLKFRTEIEYWKTEFWSTESGSKYIIEK